MNINRNEIADVVNAYYNRDFDDLIDNLNDTDKRIKFEEWLLNNFSPQEASRNEFTWHSRVIALICSKTREDATTSVDKKEKEDGLLGSLICKAESLSQEDFKIKSQLSDQARHLNATVGRVLNFPQIGAEIKNANLPSTRLALLMSLLEYEDLQVILHVAISEHNVSMIKTIANQFPEEFKTALMAQDEEGWTVLHLAAGHRHLEIVKYLAKVAPEEFKALLKIQNVVGQTPLLLASSIEQVDLELIKLLVEEGPETATILSPYGHSILSNLKMMRPSNYREIISLFKNNVELKKLHKLQLSRIALAHAYHIGGAIPLVKADTKESLTATVLEGHKPFEWFHLMSKNLSQFKERYPALLSENQAILLKQLFDLGANAKAYSAEDKVERMQAGLPTVLNTGFPGHAVTVLVWGNQFVICNRGGSSRNPIEMHHFDPLRFDKQTVLTIENMSHFGNQEGYEKLFFEELPEKLAFNQNEFDKQMEVAHPLPEQTVGNCSFVSPTTAIYAFMLLGALRGIGEQGNLENEPLKENRNEKIERAISSYQTWLSDLQISFLDKAIRPLEKENQAFEPDHTLLRVALREAYLLPLDEASQRRVEELTTLYMKSLTGQAATELKSDLIYWKSMNLSRYYIH